MIKRGFEGHFKKVLGDDGNIITKARKSYKTLQAAQLACLRIKEKGIIMEPFFCQYCNNYDKPKEESPPLQWWDEFF